MALVNTVLLEQDTIEVTVGHIPVVILMISYSTN
jgi:hypothetical protein